MTESVRFFLFVFERLSSQVTFIAIRQKRAALEQLTETENYLSVVRLKVKTIIESDRSNSKEGYSISNAKTESGNHAPEIEVIAGKRRSAGVKKHRTAEITTQGEAILRVEEQSMIA